MRSLFKYSPVIVRDKNGLAFCTIPTGQFYVEIKVGGFDSVSKIAFQSFKLIDSTLQVVKFLLPQVGILLNNVTLLANTGLVSYRLRLLSQLCHLPRLDDLSLFP